jgi:hypothetical protein
VQVVECWLDGQRTGSNPSGAYFVDITQTK